MSYEEADLYGDLESIGALEEAKKSKKRCDELEKQKNLLESELNETKDQVKKLTDEKNVLQKNLLAVWNTAKAEMERKDKRISDLNSKIASTNGGGDSISNLHPNKCRRMK